MTSPDVDRTCPEQPSGVVLGQLLSWLRSVGYRFVTPTPATHARVVGRAAMGRAKTIRDAFGWSLPFEPDLLEPPRLARLHAGGVIGVDAQGLWKSRIRISSLDDLLFVHSAYPTDDKDAVFFGPDSYRFARFIQDRLDGAGERPRIADIGAGAGVGGIVAGRLRPDADVWLTDVNAGALWLARVNAADADVPVTLCQGPGLSCAEGAFDVVLCNPPYIVDASGRAYRDGGGLHGARLALDLALEAVERLTPGGRLLLYTGAPIVDGRDELLSALAPRLPADRFALDYRERDPDVFGEELERSAYAQVERIAVVEAVVTRRS